MFGIFKRKRLTKLEPAAAIDQVIEDHIAPYLKTEGFKKYGRTWRKDFNDYSFIINVQSSRWNGKATGANFVVNYGIFVPSNYEKYFKQAVPHNPKEYDCMYRSRLKRRKREIWWEIFDTTDVDKIGIEVCTLLTEQALREFEKIHALSDVPRTSIENEFR